ncbi:MAG: hypothetical protein JWP04_2092 [Belnapia sp.]|nr:hypothetical protein [Belnapia sp.]
MPSIDPEALGVLRQALGLDRAAMPYRNHFPAPDDDPVLLGLVRQGLMAIGQSVPGGLRLFHVTPAGARRIGSPLPPTAPDRIIG